MNIRDILGLAVKNLLRRRARTLLAMVGVAVGVFAIVVMLSIGFGLSSGYQEQMESYGNLHLIEIYNYRGMQGSDGKPLVLDDRAIAKIGSFAGVGGITPVISEYLYFGIGKFVASSQIVGIDPDVIEKFGYEMQDGRMLSASDRYGVVLGNNIQYQFYNPKKQQYASWSSQEVAVDVYSDKLVITADWRYGQKESQITTGDEQDKIIYEKYNGKVVGIMANPDGNMSYRSLMNIMDLKKIRTERNRAEKNVQADSQGYEEAWVYVDSIDEVAAVNEEIKALGFSTNSLIEWLDSMKETAARIQAVLGGIGAISLLVAAIGITNTMIMSIYERTREIGVMKVIGANLKDISRMFLVEAGLIGLLGGCIGLLFSYSISLAMNTVLQPFMAGILQNMGSAGSTISIIPLWVALAAPVFATTIGVAAGYYPARRAMRLSALESLKNE